MQLHCDNSDGKNNIGMAHFAEKIEFLFPTNPGAIREAMIKGNPEIGIAGIPEEVIDKMNNSNVSPFEPFEHGIFFHIFMHPFSFLLLCLRFIFTFPHELK